MNNKFDFKTKQNRTIQAKAKKAELVEELQEHELEGFCDGNTTAMGDLEVLIQNSLEITTAFNSAATPIISFFEAVGWNIY